MEAPLLKIVFRCDASIQIGSGHVMRCLTLANELAQQGAECSFICRRHHGNLIEKIQEHGHQVYPLPLESDSYVASNNKAVLAHADWLASTQQRDAELSRSIVEPISPDWLIVDHYSLDESWEKRLRQYCKKIMVIDDLADRKHDCDILLDQNFGRNPQDYYSYINKNCELLCGPIYTLLRPEFAEWREYSLYKRRKGDWASVLINLGGVDKDNITTKILKALQSNALPDQCSIVVVMGLTSPWIEVVKQQASIMPWITEVKVGVDNIAELMAHSDLAIGAAGSTSWERCCLGVPTIMLILADNQRAIARALEDAGAAQTFEIAMLETEPLAFGQYIEAVIPKMKEMSKAASAITDGFGVSRVSKALIQ